MKRSSPTRHASLAARAVLLFVILSPSGTGAETPAVFYVTGEGTRFELRTYDPMKGTRTILETSGEPSDFYWTRDFETITFRVGDELFESDWRFGSEARKAVTLPPVSNRVDRKGSAWYDTASRAWRYYEIQYPADDAKEWKYYARVFQYDEDTGEWETLVERETYGCEQGNGSGCGAEVESFASGRRQHVSYARLSEAMRLGRLMNDRGLEYEASMEDKDFWFELGGKEISVVPVFGDSLHAMAPAKWNDGNEPRIVFPAGLEYPCMDQIGLERFGSFLLVATEWYGRCGRVIDLETGETVHELPKNARSAVVVPWPEGE